MRSDRNWTTAIVASTRDVAPHIREIWLEPESGASPYPSGSHLAIRVLINGGSDLRYYSLVGDAPRDGCWRIAVKREEPGRGGSAYMWSLKPGARVEVAAPDTHFELSRQASQYLLIAGGIGVTPLVGMAASLMRRGANVRFLYAAQSRQHMPFKEELAEVLGSRLELYPSDEGRRIDLAAEFSRLDDQAEVYLCGPISLLEGARSAWQAAGRARDRLVYETFGSSGRFAAEPFEVHVPSRGVHIVVEADTTMLDALEAAGVKLLADCRRGECGLCVIDVIDHTGTIDHRDVFFSEHQHAEGKRICACVSRVSGGSISVEPPFRRDTPLRSGPELKATASPSS